MGCISNIWIFSKNKNYLDLAGSFEFEKNLFWSGYIIKVEKNNITYCVTKYFEKALYYEYQLLNNNTKNLTDLVMLLFKKATCGDYSEVLKNCNDLSTYILLLNFLKQDYMILLAIKDTPGDKLSEKQVVDLKKLGFYNFSSELWRMYAGVLYMDKSVVDLSGTEKEAPVGFNAYDFLLGVDVKLSSMSWRNGNKAEIIINGFDYAVNERGLNFVVYDVKNKKLIDSVVFDYHNSFRCLRRN